MPGTTFGPSAFTRVSDAKGYLTNGVFPKMKKLQDRIALLEKEEERIAKEYGMAGHIDSVKVLQETKRRVFAARQNLAVLIGIRDDHLSGEVLCAVDHKDEERIAKEYGILGDIDPIKIIQEVRRWVEAFNESLSQLDDLNDRRLEVAQYRRNMGTKNHDRDLI